MRDRELGTRNGRAVRDCGYDGSLDRDCERAVARGAAALGFVRAERGGGAGAGGDVEPDQGGAVAAGEGSAACGDQAGGVRGDFVFVVGEDSEVELFRASAWPLEAVADPTGAGDTFLGAMAGYLAAQGAPPYDAATLRQAIVQGSMLASFTCEAFSTRRLEGLSAEDLAERLELFRAATRGEGPKVVKLADESRPGMRMKAGMNPAVR